MANKRTQTVHLTEAEALRLQVEVYWSPRKGRYSVRALEGVDRGLVIGHCTAFRLHDAVFHVSGGKRALGAGERRGKVHGTVRGELIMATELPAFARRLLGREVAELNNRTGEDWEGARENWRNVRYDLYERDCFYLDDPSHSRVRNASAVVGVSYPADIGPGAVRFTLSAYEPNRKEG